MPYFFNSEKKAKYITLTKNCLDFVSSQLCTGEEIFQSFFPNASLKVNDSRIEMEQAFKFQKERSKNWIERVLKEGIQIVEHETYPTSPPEEISVAQSIASKLIQTLTEMFSYQREISSDDYYFINDITTAMGVEAESVNAIIETVLYKKRKFFFSLLHEYLSPNQLYKCALLIYHAIHVDNYVHPAEYKYFEHINQLLDNDLVKLERVRKEKASLPPDFKLVMDRELAEYLFKTLTEIVMCDDDFEARESAFIQQIAKVLRFDKAAQDEIIQPVASAQMVKSALFPLPS